MDSNYKFHYVVVDPGNGKVLAFSLVSTYNLLLNGGIMGGGGMGMKAHIMGHHGLGIAVMHRSIITRPGMIAHP